MAKKQTQQPAQPVTAEPVKIHCPACRSEISSDGKSLFARSDRLTALEEDAYSIPKIETELKRVGQENEALQAELLKLKEKPAHVETVATEDPDAEFN